MTTDSEVPKRLFVLYLASILGVIGVIVWGATSGTHWVYVLIWVACLPEMTRRVVRSYATGWPGSRFDSLAALRWPRPSKAKVVAAGVASALATAGALYLLTGANGLVVAVFAALIVVVGVALLVRALREEGWSGRRDR